jgi:hypothetical protein
MLRGKSWVRTAPMVTGKINWLQAQPVACGRYIPPYSLGVPSRWPSRSGSVVMGQMDNSEGDSRHAKRANPPALADRFLGIVPRTSTEP